MATTSKLQHKQAQALDAAYSLLGLILDEQGHDAECAYRCLEPHCRRDHHCDTCAETDEWCDGIWSINDTCDTCGHLFTMQARHNDDEGGFDLPRHKKDGTLIA